MYPTPISNACAPHTNLLHCILSHMHSIPILEMFWIPGRGFEHKATCWVTLYILSYRCSQVCGGTELSSQISRSDLMQEASVSNCLLHSSDMFLQRGCQKLDPSGRVFPHLDDFPLCSKKESSERKNRWEKKCWL